MLETEDIVCDSDLVSKKAETIEQDIPVTKIPVNYSRMCIFKYAALRTILIVIFDFFRLYQKKLETAH